jgi:hypothetical protein
MGRSAVVSAIAVAALIAVPAQVHASEGWAINGTYEVTSNGQWAQRNDVYRDEAVFRSTWIITSTCSSLADCSGQVTSDQGWTAPVRTTAGEWRVERTIKNWEPCPDGTAADGHQMFRFYPVDDQGQLAIHGSTTLGGEDKTVAPSGACGINKPLLISIPLKLTKIS